MKITQSQLRKIIKEELEEVALMNRATQFAKQNANRKVTVAEVEKILGRQKKKPLLRGRPHSVQLGLLQALP